MARYLLIPLVSLLVLPASADIYKWVAGDSVHYSDKPQAIDAVRLDIDSQRTDRERIAGLTNPDPTDATPPAVVADATEQQRLEAERAERRKTNCDIAKRSLASLSTATRIYEPMPDGERRYLDETEVAHRKSTAQADVDKWCNSTS